MSNSRLVSYTKISPNKTSPRKHKIDTITIHCYVGQASVENAAEWFSNPHADVSCNYFIGSDGRIALIVDEKDRAWTSSNASNDNRAVTIEVASDNKHPFAVKSVVYESLINLLTDVCVRNDIDELRWKGDKSLIGRPDKQNMTVHRWFANKTCPGEYLYSRHSQIAAEVNSRLNPPAKEESKKDNVKSIGVGDTVSISSNATYYNGSDVPTWVVRKKWIAKQVKGDRVVIDKSTDGKNAINSAIHVKYLTVVKKKSDLPYMVQVEIDDLNIRKGPGTNYAKTGEFTGKGIFTIIEVKTGKGSKKGWGKLKSSTTANPKWISLDYAKRV